MTDSAATDGTVSAETTEEEIPDIARRGELELNTHAFFLTIQYIGVSVLFAELWIVFLGWRNSMHSYLFLACVASFISNLGYLLEMKAQTEEAYLTALKLSYAGRAFITFAFFMFAAKMCRIRMPGWLAAFFMLVHTGIYITILTTGNHGLYYTWYQFTMEQGSPVFSHGNGFAHDLLMGCNAAFAAVAMWWIFREYRGEKNRKAKNRLIMLVISYGVQITCFLLQLTGAFGISKYYDLTMPGGLLGTVFLLVGIFGFDLMGTREIAKDFVIDRISEGIIAVDNGGRIQYYNEPVTRLYPEFEAFFGESGIAGRIPHEKGAARPKHGDALRQSKTPYDIVDSIAEAVRADETVRVGDRIYTPEENELGFKGESYGKLYVLTDDTEHYRYMEELQKQRDIADHANEAKSLFLASMSHEIRTPINAVLGMDEMGRRETNEKKIRA